MWWVETVLGLRSIRSAGLIVRLFGRIFRTELWWSRAAVIETVKSAGGDCLGSKSPSTLSPPLEMPRAASHAD